MIETEDRMPDHSTSKGYPYDFPKSWDDYKQDSRARIEHTREGVEFAVIPNKQTVSLSDVSDHLINSLKALEVAEQQVKDLLLEAPFVPEDFGFECIHKPANIGEAPIRVYESKLCPVTMHRKPGTDNIWVLLQQDNDNVFRETELHFPCHRIAYAAFVALGIKVDKDATEVPEGGVVI